MQKTFSLRLKPAEAAQPDIITDYIAAAAGLPRAAVTGFYPTRKSIDARSRQPWINLTVMASLNEPFLDRPAKDLPFQDVGHASRSAVIIGAGPAGLFAALEFLQQGIRPILLERGKDVRQRRRDLAVLNKEGMVNPDSNYCFGEGGAGTYSDGNSTPEAINAETSATYWNCWSILGPMNGSSTKPIPTSAPINSPASSPPSGNTSSPVAAPCISKKN